MRKDSSVPTNLSPYDSTCLGLLRWKGSSFDLLSTLRLFDPSTFIFIVVITLKVCSVPYDRRETSEISGTS